MGKLGAVAKVGGIGKHHAEVGNQSHPKRLFQPVRRVLHKSVVGHKIPWKHSVQHSITATRTTVATFEMKLINRCCNCFNMLCSWVRYSSTSRDWEDVKLLGQKPKNLPANEDETYDVHKILSDRTNYGEKEYLVRWTGYSMHDSSWTRESDLSCPKKLKEYLASKNGK